MNKILRKYILIIVALLVVTFASAAQESDGQQPSSGAMTVNALFEYPTAPEEINGLAAKSEWLLQHFWDQMDFKQKSVDQTALNHAFSVYVVPMRFASKNVADKSVADLLKKLKKNPGLLYQFTRAAEENIYSPKATVWIDEIYLQFLNTAIANKKIANSRKLRWQVQKKQIENCLVGQPMIPFNLQDRSGKEGPFSPGNLMTVIEFGDPGCDDCRISRLKMESNAALMQKVKSGELAVYFIVTDPESSWVLETLDYPKSWTVAAATTADDDLDLRATPSFYVIGADGKILAKNVTVNEAISIVTQ